MRSKRTATLMTLCSGLLFAFVTANAQTTVDQVLDSTFVHGPDKAAELVFNDPDRQYEYLGIAGTDFRTCKLTALDGLYCLDYKTLRSWPHPSTSSESLDIVDCEDPVLGLDAKKDNTCTGFTVDLDGAIWIAGKNKGKSHSLIKLVEHDGSCPPAPFVGAPELGVLTSNGDYCAYEFATGRPLLVDLEPVDGTVAEQFSLPGYPAPLQAILGLEERKTAVAFLESGEVVAFADKKAFGLAGKEQLLGITALQLEEPLQNFVLVATTFGRVLAWETTGTGAVTEVFNVESAREQATFDQGPCSSDDPTYGVRASTTTNLVYVTDSEYCEVIVLKAVRDSGLLSLVHATDAYTDATLSTLGLTSPTGVSVAPGNIVDLSNCDDPANPCPLVSNNAGVPIATLAGVQLHADSASGLALFQIEGMPDCRYVPFACLAILDPDGTPPATTQEAVAALRTAGVIVPLQLDQFDGRDADTYPGAQRLNITPLLPTEITELFPGDLPEMLITHYVRGQQINEYVFGGFFGITQDGVVFRDTFEGEFDVYSLAGASLGCADDLGSLNWDIVGTVSDSFISADEPHAVSSPQHVMWVNNSDCGSSRTRDIGWSFKPYNLEPTPCTFNPDAAGIWSDDGMCELPDSGTPEVADDAVYAKMLLVMADDYVRMLDQLACADGDGNGAAPLSASDCLSVQGQVDNVLDKLHKCWDATRQPKQSSGDQNCQAFDSQLMNLQSMLGLIMPVDPDVANRVGELKARAMIMRHVLETRFIPSLLLLLNEQFVEP